MGTTTINLSCVDTDYLGLLFREETGIMYTTQVGGTCCSHPLVEGFFVLLNGCGPEVFPAPFHERGSKRYVSQDPFHDQGPTTYRTEHKAAVEELLGVLGLSDVLEAPDVCDLAEEWWAEICEAWIPIKVREDASGYEAAMVEELKGRVGVLIYPNSD